MIDPREDIVSRRSHVGGGHIGAEISPQGTVQGSTSGKSPNLWWVAIWQAAENAVGRNPTVVKSRSANTAVKSGASIRMFYNDGELQWLLN